MHLFGQLADMTRFTPLAQEHGLPLIGDGAQAIGASHQDKPLGGWCDLTTLSFYPTKNLGACGDAGMVLTDNADYAEKIKLLRFHGSGGSYFHKTIGYCSRLDGLQAALLRVKARRLHDWNDARRRNAALYHSALSDLGGRLTLPVTANGNHHIYHQYTLRVPDGSPRRSAKVPGRRGRAVGDLLSAVAAPPGSLCLAWLRRRFPAGKRAGNARSAVPARPPGSDSAQVSYVAESVRRFSRK